MTTEQENFSNIPEHPAHVTFVESLTNMHDICKSMDLHSPVIVPLGQLQTNDHIPESDKRYGKYDLHPNRNLRPDTIYVEYDPYHGQPQWKDPPDSVGFDVNALFESNPEGLFSRNYNQWKISTRIPLSSFPGNELENSDSRIKKRLEMIHTIIANLGGGGFDYEQIESDGEYINVRINAKSASNSKARNIERAFVVLGRCTHYDVARFSR